MACKRGVLVGGLAVACMLVATPVVLGQATDPWIGTWKLNLAKSTYSPGPPPKSNTLKIEVVAGGLQKHTFDGLNAQGQPTHSERLAKFDSTDVPVQAVQPPSQAVATNAFRRLDARSFEVVGKSDGKVAGTNRIVISPDGKTMTVTVVGTDAQGQKVNSTIVYDRQ